MAEVGENRQPPTEGEERGAARIRTGDGGFAMEQGAYANVLPLLFPREKRAFHAGKRGAKRKEVLVTGTVLGTVGRLDRLPIRVSRADRRPPGRRAPRLRWTDLHRRGSARRGPGPASSRPWVWPSSTCAVEALADEHLAGDGIRNREWLGECAHRDAQPQLGAATACVLTVFRRFPHNLSLTRSV